MQVLPTKQCARIGCENKFQVTSNAKSRRFCSLVCAGKNSWATKRRKENVRRNIPKLEVISRVYHGGENEADVASSYNTSISTIYRILSEAGLRGKTGMQKKKQIFIPRDKTVFVIAVDQVRAGDAEIILRQALKAEQLLTDKFVMQTYDPNFTVRTAVQTLKRQQQSKEINPMTASPIGIPWMALGSPHF